MGLEALQRYLTNDLLVFRAKVIDKLERFQYTGKNVLLGDIKEARYRAGSFDALGGYAFGGILGGAQPSDYSLSITLWNEYFQSTGTRALFFGFDIPPDEKEGKVLPGQPRVVEFIRAALGEKGLYELTVTDPYKRVAFEYLESIRAGISENARNIGVVNHIVRGKDGRVYGLNTDGLGMVKAISEKRDIRASDVLMLGAGGSATAVAYELLGAGAKSLYILNRTKARAEELVSRLGKTYDVPVFSGGLEDIDSRIAGADVIIHAVTEGTVLGIDAAKKSKDSALFVDTRYGKKAALKGIADSVRRDFLDGKGMLFWQFVEALDIVEPNFFMRDANLDGIMKARYALENVK